MVADRRARASTWVFHGAERLGVPVPNCATGGTPQIVFSPVSFYVNPTATVNVSASGSGPWTVFITDGNGNGIGGTAVVETYCSY